jgi:hypothetical protein
LALGLVLELALGSVDRAEAADPAGAAVAIPVAAVADRLRVVPEREDLVAVAVVTRVGAIPVAAWAIQAAVCSAATFAMRSLGFRAKTTWAFRPPADWCFDHHKPSAGLRSRSADLL